MTDTDSKIARVVRAAQEAQNATQHAARLFGMLDAVRREHERLTLEYAQAQLHKLECDRAMADAMGISNVGIARKLTLSSARYSKLGVQS